MREEGLLRDGLEDRGERRKRKREYAEISKYRLSGPWAAACGSDDTLAQERGTKTSVKDFTSLKDFTRLQGCDTTYSGHEMSMIFNR